MDAPPSPPPAAWLRWVLLALLLLFPLCLLDLLYSQTLVIVRQPGALGGLFPYLRLLLIITAGLDLLFPWLSELRLIYLPWRFPFLPPASPYHSLLVGWMLTSAPAIFGLVLYFFGASQREAIYFIIASMLGSLLWGVYSFLRPAS